MNKVGVQATAIRAVRVSVSGRFDRPICACFIIPGQSLSVAVYGPITCSLYVAPSYGRINSSNVPIIISLLAQHDTCWPKKSVLYILYSVYRVRSQLNGKERRQRTGRTCGALPRCVPLSSAFHQSNFTCPSRRLPHWTCPELLNASLFSGLWPLCDDNFQRLNISDCLFPCHSRDYPLLALLNAQ